MYLFYQNLSKLETTIGRLRNKTKKKKKTFWFDD